jgi:hypothetical protein
VVAGIGNGDLKFKADNLIYSIISATGELKRSQGRRYYRNDEPCWYSL